MPPPPFFFLHLRRLSFPTLSLLPPRHSFSLPLSLSHDLFLWDGVEWCTVPGKAKDVCAHSRNLAVALDPEGKPFVWTGSGDWSPLLPSEQPLARIVISHCGQRVAALGQDGSIFAWAGMGWLLVPCCKPLASLAISFNLVVGVTMDGHAIHLPLFM